jgi:pimeloyl-ACP methyl ester carboxylesterase
MLDTLATILAHGLRLVLLVGASALEQAQDEPQEPPQSSQTAEEQPQEQPARAAAAHRVRGLSGFSGSSAAPSTDQRRVARAPRGSVAGQRDEVADSDSDVLGFLHTSRSLVRDRQSVSVQVLPPTGPDSSLLEVTISPGTGFVEMFLVQVPKPPASTPQPLLVVFHGYAGKHLEVQQETEFLQEADARGWFVMAPLGASKKHFSSIESQLNTEAVFNWVLAGFGSRIDTQRIYAVGFSMGGGAATNYAARHLDPSRPMIAAVVDHAGGVALNNTYYHEIPAVQAILDFWFGDGSPGSADPWKMSRSSVIDFDPNTLVTNTDDDLARNLMHVPLRITRAWMDPIGYVNDQCDAFDQHMRNLGKVVGPEYSYEFVPRGQQITEHSWSILPFEDVCDWLAQHTLQLPTEARTLADRDAKYFHFYVQQDASGAFTPFDWKVDLANNGLEFKQTRNLSRATVETLDAGLDPQAPISLIVDTADGNADEIVLTRIASWPASVLLDGNSNSLNWAYDPVSQKLSLTAPDGGAHTWQIWP